MCKHNCKSGLKFISMCIVPVKIKHGDSNKMVTTYAVLDNCSQGFFILHSSIKKLGIQGIKKTLKLKTLHGERSESTFAIEDVKVTGMHGDSGWIALPKLYSRIEIPVDKEEIQLQQRSENGSICNLYQMKLFRMMMFMLVY